MRSWQELPAFGRKHSKKHNKKLINLYGDVI